MRHALLRLHSPLAQNVIADACVAFLPGLFVALAALGAGGGRASLTQVAQNTNAIIYSLYAFTAYFCGILLNTIGPRYTLSLGGLGYPIYMGSFWYFGITGNVWFPYLSGVVLGLSAGLLWATAGYVAIAYSDESTRSRYLGMQNVIVAFGGMIGSAIAFGISEDKTSSAGVPDSVYIAFICLMCTAIVCAALFLVDPSTVVRNDGTHLAAFKEQTGLWNEFKESLILFKDWRLALLIPVMFSGEFPLWVASVNAYAFDLRSRTLLGLIYSFSQAPGGYFLCFILDSKRMSRRTRGMLACVVMALVIYGAWFGFYGWTLGKNLDRSQLGPNYDWSDGRSFAPFLILYFLFGAMYVSVPLLIQWVLSSMTNSPRKLARLASMYKGINAAVFGVDSTLPPFVNEFAYALALQGFSIFILFYMCAFHVTDTRYFQEDEVIVPKNVVRSEKDVKHVEHENQMHHQLDKPSPNMSQKIV